MFLEGLLQFDEPKPEYQALLELKNNPHLVIKKADKGSFIVFQDTEDYLREGFQHLSDKKIYIALPGDPMPTLALRRSGVMLT